MVDWDRYPVVTIIIFLVLCALYVMTGAWAYTHLEDWSYRDSVYFCMVTITTIGYGDLYPTTVSSKLFTIVFIFISLFIVFAVFHVVIGFIVHKQVVRIKRRLKRGANKSVDPAEMATIIDSRTTFWEYLYQRIFRCCSKLTAVIIYATFYFLWLIVWTLYFAEWNNHEKDDFSFFNAFYFGVVTSSTVGYGDQSPNGLSDTKSKYDDSRMFAACFCVVGSILLALLSNEVSRGLIWLLYYVFACPCLCEHEVKEEETVKLSKRTVRELRDSGNGSISFENFMRAEFDYDESFIKKWKKADRKFAACGGQRDDRQLVLGRSREHSTSHSSRDAPKSSGARKLSFKRSPDTRGYHYNSTKKAPMDPEAGISLQSRPSVTNRLSQDSSHPL